MTRIGVSGRARIGLVLLAVVCAAVGPPGDAELPDLPPCEAPSQADVDALVASGVPAAESRFALKLLDGLVRTEPTANQGVCPLSAFAALSLLSQGAGPEARRELDVALGLQAIEPDVVARSLCTLHASLLHRPEATLDLATLVGLAPGYEPEAAFVARARKDFRGVVATLDFGAVDAAARVNRWAERTTGGRLPTLTKGFAPGTGMWLASLCTFSAWWEAPFEVKKTHAGTFTDVSGNEIPVDLMHSGSTFDHLHDADLGFQALRLPYGENLDAWATRIEDALEQPEPLKSTLSMVVLLPDEGHTVPQVLEALSQVDPQSLLARLSPAYGVLELPRFRIECRASLVPALRRLGLSHVFEPGPDVLQGISASGALAVSDMSCTSIVAVNETGTTMSSIVEMTYFGFGGDEKDFSFICNRPFAFLIVDGTTQSVLYTGVLNTLR